MARSETLIIPYGGQSFEVVGMFDDTPDAESFNITKVSLIVPENQKRVDLTEALNDYDTLGILGDLALERLCDVIDDYDEDLDEEEDIDE